MRIGARRREPENVLVFTPFQFLVTLFLRFCIPRRAKSGGHVQMLRLVANFIKALACLDAPKKNAQNEREQV
jgi:hypothetical protein